MYLNNKIFIQTRYSKSKHLSPNTLSRTPQKTKRNWRTFQEKIYRGLNLVKGSNISYMKLIHPQILPFMESLYFTSIMNSKVSNLERVVIALQVILDCDHHLVGHIKLCSFDYYLMFQLGFHGDTTYLMMKVAMVGLGQQRQN